MPYTPAEARGRVLKTYPDASTAMVRQWATVWNKVYAETGDEGQAFAAAYAALKKRKTARTILPTGPLMTNIRQVVAAYDRAETFLNPVLSVDDYLEEADGDEESAFDLASEDTTGAIKMAQLELKHLMPDWKRRGVTIGKAEFHEFDSRNISHAGAYWNVAISGPGNAIAELNKALEEQGR